MSNETSTQDQAEETVAAVAEQTTDTIAETVETVEQVVSSTEEALASASDTMIDAVTNQQQQTIAAAKSAAEAFMGLVGRARNEMTEFVAERIRHDLDAQQALLRCRSFEDFRVIQRDYVRTAFDQYSAGAARIVRLSTEAATKAIEPVNA